MLKERISIKTFLAIMASVSIIMICLTTTMSCGKKEDEPSNTEKQRKSYDYINASMAQYYPLTADRLNNILNGNESCGIIVLHYSAWTQPYPNSEQDLLQLHLDAGTYLSENTYTQLSVYRGGLVKEIRSVNPPGYSFHEKNFTPAEAQVIYDYMIAHSDYFFNAEEYDGEESWRGKNLCVGGPANNGNYCFCMSIQSPGNPGTYPIPAWAISKCVDEYPEQGTPLYGLFQILENDFIDEFE